MALLGVHLTLERQDCQFAKAHHIPGTGLAAALQALELAGACLRLAVCAEQKHERRSLSAEALQARVSPCALVLESGDTSRELAALALGARQGHYRTVQKLLWLPVDTFHRLTTPQSQQQLQSAWLRSESDAAHVTAGGSCPAS